VGVLLVLVGSDVTTRDLAGDGATGSAALAANSAGPAYASLPLPLFESMPAEPLANDVLTAVVQRNCVPCHNDVALTADLSLQSFDVAKAFERAEIAEKMVRKLRAGMMPPPGMPRPAGDTLRSLVETIEKNLDDYAARNPNPGDRPFQRLNRAEYESSIHELLGLEVDAGKYLPLDTKSANFDNIADVQTLSPTLLSAYLSAASEISRLALGDPNATPTEATFTVPRTASQTRQVEGAPYGSRGGISEMHTFPADGEYSFRISFYHETTGGFVGGNARGEQIEISIDGERVLALDVDRFMRSGDPNQTTQYTEPVFVRAGPHRVSAVFIPPEFQDVVQDLTSPLDWSLASTAIAGTYGYGLLPHMRDFVIFGPVSTTGVSDTPVRRKIFTCRPLSSEEERPCAESIVSRLSTQAFRRPLSRENLNDLMAFYDLGAEKGGFEVGIRTALEATLASPDFYFRFETMPADVRPGESYRISDYALASRLSFFLWSAPPDQELLELASKGKLSDRKVLEQQVRRMLADPRSETLATRFAAQWLRLEDLDKVFPDIRDYVDFDEQLRASMRRETELFFADLIRDDKSILNIYTADYTFVDERLAKHYGIPDVAGTHFRKVNYADDTRRGVLGHGSVLVQTSHATRTSPVLRGKWVMEVLLNTPPPPPPPGVPDLEQTEGASDGKFLTTRQRMEKHRAADQCRSCHLFMDPIGLALDNFDVTGRWRIKESGVALDTQGTLYDGTPISSPGELLQALLARPTPLVRTFTGNLMAYALGRRLEYYDQPLVRAIVGEAEKADHHFSAYVMGVVNSPAFQMQRAEVAAAGSH
jgi:hypothetical protein